MGVNVAVNMEQQRSKQGCTHGCKHGCLLTNLQKCLEKIYFTQDIKMRKYEASGFYATPFKHVQSCL